MDRLPALIAFALAAATVGCDEKPTGEPTGRANSAKVAPTRAADPAAFCDKLFPGDSGPKITYPAVVDGTLPAPGTNWRWINAWSTWCKPCVEELPRLLAFRDKRATSKSPVDVVLFSVDDDAGAVTDFRKEQPAVPATRLASPQDQFTWYASVGLDAAAPLPVHVFVTPSGHVRCARAGAVREADFAAVAAVLR